MRRFLVALMFIAAPLSAYAEQSDMVLAARASEAPFAGPALPQKGMAIELATAAFAQGPSPLPVQIDWTTSKRDKQMSFPGPDAYLSTNSPQCDGPVRATDSCSGAYYSDPLIDLVVLLFVRVEDEPTFLAPDGFAQKKVCYVRAQDPVTGVLSDPAWLLERNLTLFPAPDIGVCFARLATGDADGVAVDEFRGIRELFRQNQTERVVPLTEPLGRQSLHVAISKSHWRATAHLLRINAGLAELRRSGAYAEIVARHTAAFWAEVGG